MMLVSLATVTHSADSPATEDPQPTPKPGMWCWSLSSLCVKCNSVGTMRAYYIKSCDQHMSL